MLKKFIKEPFTTFHDPDEEVSIKNNSQEFMRFLKKLLVTCFKMVMEKCHYFKKEVLPVLRKFKLESEDDRIFVSKFVVTTVLRILLIIATYSFCYYTMEFKTVRP